MPASKKRLPPHVIIDNFYKRRQEDANKHYRLKQGKELEAARQLELLPVAVTVPTPTSRPPLQHDKLDPHCSCESCDP